MSSLIKTVTRRRLGEYVCNDCLKQITQQTLSRRWITQNGIRKVKIAQADWSDRRDDIESGKAQSILQVLEDRGLINQIVGSRDALEKVLIERRVGVYCGVDPTAPSLHIGHMIPFMALGWMYVYGYSATYLVRRKDVMVIRADYNS